MTTQSNSSDALLQSVISAYLNANGTRFLTAAGLVCLLYDHILTFTSEVSLIWRAPRSFPKYLFLANRYLVLTAIITVNTALSGISDRLYDDASCRGALLFASLSSIVSIGAANLLILIRVLLLWDKERHVLIILITAWFVSYCATIGLMTATVVILAPGVQWDPLIRICAVTRASPTLIAVWALPMLFEVSIFFATIYNSISRPRASGVPLASTLHRDGALFFFAVTCLRIVNLAFAATQRPQLIAYPVFFTWSLITICVHRLLLHIRAAEVHLALEEQRALAAAASEALSPLSPESPEEGALVLNGRASPFGLVVALRHRRHDYDEMHDHAPNVPIMMVELQSFYR